MNKKYLKIFSAIVTSVLAVILLSHDRQLFATQRPNALSVEVVRVHDGDTVSVIIGGKKEKVRLIGIDVPELGQRPWGKKAKKHIEELLNETGWRVILEFDVEKRDKYGRLLAYLWTPDKRLINLDMLKDGYAVLFTFPPNVKYVNSLRDAQRSAREKGLGIWGKNGLREMPEDYKRAHPR